MECGSEKTDGRVCSGDAGAEEHGVPAGRERRGIQLSPHTRATQQLSTWWSSGGQPACTPSLYYFTVVEEAVLRNRNRNFLP